MFEKEITFDRFIRGLMVVAGLGLAIYVLNLLKAVLLPFFVAWFLAYMIYPTIKFFNTNSTSITGYCASPLPYY
mgnify:CR=1 FL=1